jgi:hypothetical protein
MTGGSAVSVGTSKTSNPVIPAKAGIHCVFFATATWIPAFAGMTV